MYSSDPRWRLWHTQKECSIHARWDYFASENDMFWTYAHWKLTEMLSSRLEKLRNGEICDNDQLKL